MTTALTTVNYPKDPTTGLTLPLSKSLGSRDLQRHRAMVAVELEVLAKKLDRFGWDRDRNTPVHDRLLVDWMDALQDYPLGEIQAACRRAVLQNPNRMVNEGHVKGEILKARRLAVLPSYRPEPDERREVITQSRADEILAEVGFKPRRVTDDPAR